jgi:signal transduction histidine kinase
VGGELRVTATWPEDLEGKASAVPASGQVLPQMHGADLAAPVSHGGELLGALTVRKRPGERLSPSEEKLALHLASQAGLVLRNLRLTEELQARLEDLRASRRRMVAAQDAERRRLERNLHDGAQQQLVALSVKVRLTQQAATRDPAAATTLVQDLAREAGDAVQTLRDLSQGIYPTMLTEHGLAGALRRQAAKAALPVTVQAEGIGRFPQEAEAAVYFCILEALQNIAKYADATAAVVHLEAGDGELRFSVTDDGRGFDPATVARGSGTRNMADRLDAVGGAVEVQSAPGAGTSVRGRVPTRVVEPPP